MSVGLYDVFLYVYAFFMVYELGVACKRAAGVFFRQQKAFSDLLTMSILELDRIVRISVFMDFGTCIKRRAPENHEFWRYWRVQIFYGDPIGDQNDEWSETSQCLHLEPHPCIVEFPTYAACLLVSNPESTSRGRRQEP